MDCLYKKKVYTSLHPKIDVGRLCWNRKNGGNGLISIKECVSIGKTSFLGFYLKEQEEQLLTEVVIEDVISNDENPKNVKTQLLQQRKENNAQKRMHSAFIRDAEEVKDSKNNWLWIKKDI